MGRRVFLQTLTYPSLASIVAMAPWSWTRPARLSVAGATTGPHHLLATCGAMREGPRSADTDRIGRESSYAENTRGRM
jgi:hypothetical protein